jgi:phenylalanine-4-hydroxylase
MEYGLIKEHGNLMVCGASLLSSYGELTGFRNTYTRPMDPVAMVTQEYDIGSYRPVLFYAESVNHFEDLVSEFLQTVDDEYPVRIMLPRTA